ncbi:MULTISPECIES: hypothetical protein [Pacificibacter]|uniref:hypothetical protein n=1 Tax=Pacificibacter TaxID=1042323 RepID=UPI001C08CAD9|nr:MULTISPECIES: hypothetical protein [Pacificibacter]MBU2936210.1 hypothetical protein [Pacificibacter marinus]MDO6616797.1 hypothetical protein [Pacificibacter sp. 1_MG-2023]
MLTNQLVEKLECALACAQVQNITLMATLLDEVRDGSYDIMPRQSAFLMRAACAAVEHVASAFDALSSAQTARSAIQQAKEAALLGGSDLNAA